MMGALNLAMYDLKRLFRHRAVTVMLFAVPLAVASTRCAAPGWSCGAAIAVWCPLVCAALTVAVLFVQRSVDSISGLSDAIRNTPLSDSTLAVSRVACGAIVLGLQMTILFGILAVRF